MIEKDDNINGLLDKVIAISKNFVSEYEAWYSEALALIKQIIPDRESDFKSLYENPRTEREDITSENYVIQDAIHGLQVSYLGEVKADRSDALPKLKQQVSILESAIRRFESKLFDITTLVQADILDSELAAARELLKHKFLRAAGAVCGVVLEKHLQTVSSNSNLKTKKKNPSIADWNDLLKNEGAIDIVKWRLIQHLGDIRNLCAHNKDREPKKEEVQDLIDGVDKVIKTTF